jgi:MFS family permease
MLVPKINLILSLICRDYYAEKASNDHHFTYLPIKFGSDNSQCQTSEISARVARFQLYLNLVAGILSALVSPRLGHLSDLYGRTKTIALCVFATAMGEVVTVVVAAWPEHMSVNVLLLGAFLDGLGGSFTCAIALVSSYASDCTVPERRSVVFGYFHGALFSGIAAGPFLAAYVIKQTGSALYFFYIALGFHLLFLLAVVLVVPESLSKERQQIAREKHRTRPDKESTDWLSLRSLNPINLVTPLSILMPPAGKPSVLFPTRHGASPALRRNIILLCAIDTAMFGVAIGTSQVIIMYAEYMFGWGNVESSIFVSVINTVRVINLFLVLPVVTRFFTKQSRRAWAIPGSTKLDIVIIRLSVFFDLLGYIGYASAVHGSFMILSGIIAALGGMGSPTLQSSLTKHVPADRVGQMLGATGLLHALARIAAPTVLNLLYSVTVGKFTPTIFVCLASVFGAALFLSFFIKPHGLSPFLGRYSCSHVRSWI